MKPLGIVIMLIGLVIGLYIGIYVLFIGGIIDMIEAARATEISGWDLLLGYVKLSISGFIGMAVGGFIALIGLRTCYR